MRKPSRQTEIRRYVKLMISEEVTALLDIGWDVTSVTEELGVSAEEIHEELRRQAAILLAQSYDGSTGAYPGRSG